MKYTFLNLIYKLIELDKQIGHHNSIIDQLKNDYLIKEKEYLSGEANVLSSYMKNLGLSYSGEVSIFNSYTSSKNVFFRHMIEMDSLFKQAKVLIKVFLGYDLMIENIDFSKKLSFDLKVILSQVSIYPKRLTLLLKRSIIDQSLYDILYTEKWLNQSVSGSNGLFFSLLKQYKMYSESYISYDKNECINLISEAFYRSDIMPTMKKINLMIEYLFCPKIEVIISESELIENYSFLSDESINIKCENLKNVI